MSVSPTQFHDDLVLCYLWMFVYFMFKICVQIQKLGFIDMFIIILIIMNSQSSKSSQSSFVILFCCYAITLLMDKIRIIFVLLDPGTPEIILEAIRDLRDKTMADKLMCIPNDETQIYPFCRLKLVVETFQHSN